MNSNQEQLETFISEVSKLLESNGFIVDRLIIGEVNLGICLKWPDDNDVRIKEIHDLLKHNGYRNFLVHFHWVYREISKKKGIEIEFLATNWLDLSLNHIPIPDFIS